MATIQYKDMIKTKELCRSFRFDLVPLFYVRLNRCISSFISINQLGSTMVNVREVGGERMG